MIDMINNNMLWSQDMLRMGLELESATEFAAVLFGQLIF